MISHQRMAVLLAAALLLLTGCSVEPSEADIKKAFETELSQIKGVQANLAPKLHGLKKLSCTKAEGNPGYNCDVELDVENFLGQRQKNAVKVRFVKSDDGWVAIEERR
jgi:outer membrane biogenesis lipoprotein LolB